MCSGSTILEYGFDKFLEVAVILQSYDVSIVIQYEIAKEPK